MARTHRLTALVAGLALVATACTKKTEAPALSGPSELSTSISLSANPDVLTQDGQSQAIVVVQARDANAQPIKNLPLRADITVNGTITDFGQLSAKNLATGSDGRATLLYTAPSAVDNVDRQTLVTIAITPTTGDATGDVARTVQIRLVPAGVVSGGLTQVPDFTVSPSAPTQLQTVIFDASDPTLDSKLIAYVWDFGDGSSGSGRTASHQYRKAGTFSVTLTVTDTGGSKGSRSKSVPVGVSELPVASFVFSPAVPGIGEEIVFNASPSTATAPRTIVSYDWQFGTDRTGSGMIVTKKYDTPGTYNVTLTVTDDAGNKSTATQAVTVGTSSAGGLSANFTFSPSSPVAPAVVSFDASTSTFADPIVSYTWNFGEGDPLTTTSSPLVTNSYGAPGDYTVTLTIKDSKGRTATMTQTVTVS